MEEEAQKSAVVVSSSSRLLHCFVALTFDIDYGPKIDFIEPANVTFTEKEALTLTFSAFPESSSDVGDNVFCVRLPGDAITSHKADGYYAGACFFRQEKDANNLRGYSQRSLVVLSSQPLLTVAPILTNIITTVAPHFFQVGKSLLEKATAEIKLWPVLSTQPNSDLTLLGKSFEFVPQVSVGNVSEFKWSKKFDDILLNGFSIFENFRSMSFSKLETLWEILLLAEPLLVITSSPSQASAVVLSLVQLIAPIPYGGDYRPYVTIHDPEIHRYAELLQNGAKSATSSPSKAKTSLSASGKDSDATAFVLGACNHIFRREYAHWPNVITLNNPTGKGVDKPSPWSPATIARYLSIPTREQNTDSEAMLQYKAQIPSESADIKKGLTKIPQDLGDDEFMKQSNKVIREFFLERTLAFLAPLEAYIQTLHPSQVTILKGIPKINAFKEADFLRHYSLNGGKDIDLYRRFLRTANFSNWFREKKSMLNNGLLSSLIDPKKIKAATEGMGEIQLVDVVLRLIDLKKQFELTEDLSTRLIDAAKDIIRVLPDAMQTNLQEQLGIPTTFE